MFIYYLEGQQFDPLVPVVCVCMFERNTQAWVVRDASVNLRCKVLL